MASHRVSADSVSFARETVGIGTYGMEAAVQYTNRFLV